MSRLTGPLGEPRSRTRTPAEIISEIRALLGDEPWWDDFSDDGVVDFLIGQQWPWRGSPSLLTEYRWAVFVHLYLPDFVKMNGEGELSRDIQALLD